MEWRIFHDLTVWLTPDLLAIKPLPGFPLRPDTEYAAFVTTAVAVPAPRLAELWDDPGYAHLAATLERDGHDRSERGQPFPRSQQAVQPRERLR